MNRGKIWVTSKARMQFEKRLLFLANQSQYLLLWYAFCTVAVSIYYLRYSSDSQFADIVWVEFSLLVFVVSISIKTNTFKERSNLVKECYLRLSELHNKRDSYTDDEAAEEYTQILDICENHDAIDYHKAICESLLITPKEERHTLEYRPTKFMWVNFYWSHLLRFLSLSLLYTLPVILFFLTGK